MMTHHSIKRAQKRAGLSKTSAARLIENAMLYGQEANSFDGREREYLQRKAKYDGEHTVLYNNYCFVIGKEDVCITMFPVPAWFGKKEQHIGKNKIRDARKYFRNYFFDDKEDELLGCT